MSDQVILKNLSGAILALDSAFYKNRSIDVILKPSQSVDVSERVTFAELERDPVTTRLRSKGILQLRTTAPLTQTVTLTQPGASPYHIVFANVGLKDMVDTSYEALLDGETAAQIEESTLSTTGFDVIGGNIGDVLHIVIIGQVAT